jgi:hypothetical protein
VINGELPSGVAFSSTLRPIRPLAASAKISLVILAVDVHAEHHPAVVHLTERMKRVKLEDDTIATMAMGQAGDVTGGRNGREGK